MRNDLPQHHPENDDSHLSTRSKDFKIPEAMKKITGILPLAYGYLWTAALISMPHPFYPPLASVRGLATWQSGFVFSAMKIGMFLGSLSVHKMISCLSPTKTYLIGQGVSLLYSLLFGLLYWIPEDVFLCISILAMLLGGFSMIIQNIIMYTAVTTLFSSNRGTLILWAFPLPFFAVGVLQILSFPFIALNGVSQKEHPKADDKQTFKSNMKLRRLLWDPIFLLNMVTITLSWVIIGFNEPTLEPNIEQFHLSSFKLGAFFMVPPFCYAAGAVAAGLFCHFEMETFFAFFSQLMTAIAYLIIGPAPFIKKAPSLSPHFTSIVTPGSALLLICILLPRSQGYPDDLKTTGFVSSVVFGFLVFGGLVTPPLGGYLVDTFGYRKGSMFMFATLLAW
ncbi:unnamed protein product, partial [Ixodes hexagonus]